MIGAGFESGGAGCSTRPDRGVHGRLRQALQQSRGTLRLGIDRRARVSSRRLHQRLAGISSPRLESHGGLPAQVPLRRFIPLRWHLQYRTARGTEMASRREDGSRIEFKGRVGAGGRCRSATACPITARHELHPNQVNAWKRQLSMRRRRCFARGAARKRPSSCEADLHDLLRQDRRAHRRAGFFSRTAGCER